MTTSLIDVQARWGYSEIADGPASHLYGDDPQIEALRERRRSGVPFDQLTTLERRHLANVCAVVRQSLFVCFQGIELFDLIPLTREQLGPLWVPPNVWRDSQGKSYPFCYYITTTTEEVGDARCVAPPSDGYQVPPDPLTVGRLNSHHFLIDGYHRAALFWKYGPSDGTIFAYVPAVPPSDSATD